MQLLAAIVRALAAAGRFTWVTVWEGGKFVSRLVRTALTPPDPVGEAEAELAHELTAPVEQEPSPAEQWGRAAMLHMAGEPQASAGVLDDAARAYLDTLTVDQQVALSQNDPATIGRHLLGERLLPSLPRPPTPAEFRAIEAARAAAAAAEAQQEMDADDFKNRHFKQVLDDLIVEDLPKAA
ncbi:MULTISPECIES: hypothetical protein [Methylobacteriaceae]|uniref:Uncharacterized protein n=1 Tax=Methylorubrum thiocyanatum TaxID=47958 RepID=A0AA40S5N4_9HYPH|nr:hypothetical protein [Methylorubrum thiocyanatum]AWI88379.1 hypothetical protein C0214_09045 [Methylobacterium sp. DM1]MBA8914973.1 hypothetical protein [Methylorubrum thiocyanatum]GJE79380.1 hypothetical protein CJNNKLLH_0706 [Methylorubrum thiocyanatum]